MVFHKNNEHNNHYYRIRGLLNYLHCPARHCFAVYIELEVDASNLAKNALEVHLKIQIK